MTLLDMLLYFLVVAYLVADLVVIVLWLIPSYAVSVSAHLFISCSLAISAILYLRRNSSLSLGNPPDIGSDKLLTNLRMWYIYISVFPPGLYS